MRALPILLAPALVAGCLAPPTDLLGGARASSAPPVVVAVIDTGVNAYHEAFRAGPSFADVPGFAGRAVAITLDAGSFGDGVAADAGVWASIGEREIVWFSGTRIAAYSISKDVIASHVGQENVIDPPYRVLDYAGHGTVTSHAALDASPHAVVVLVQIGDDEEIADAMRWIATQAWIDLVSVSWGTWAEEYAMGEVRVGLPDAYREAARAGKLLFNAAGNEPLPHVLGEHSGPPFVVAVGGANNRTRGDVPIAARFPDVVAAFEQVRATRDSLDAAEPTMGTSLSAPFAAGVAAEALWLVRNAIGARSGGTAQDGALAIAVGGGALADGALTADELRAAVERRADYYAPTDWSPGTDLLQFVISAPVVHPAAQMGWGVVEPTHAPDVAAILLGEVEAPVKPADVEAFMAARHEVRAAAWGEV